MEMGRVSGCGGGGGGEELGDFDVGGVGLRRDLGGGVRVRWDDKGNSIAHFY